MADDIAGNGNPPDGENPPGDAPGVPENPQPVVENDPIAIQKRRTTSKAAHTRQTNKIRAAVRDRKTPAEIIALSEVLFELYENSVAYHLQFCALTQRVDEDWLTRLEGDYNETHDIIKRYLEGRQAQPVPNVRNNVPEDHRSSESSASSRASSNRHSFGTAPSVPGDIPNGGPGAGAATPSVDGRSASGVSSRSSALSRNSSAATLERQRKVAELELKLQKQRQEAEEADNARLAELERTLAEERRRVESKKMEREIQDEITRLQLTETLMQGTGVPLAPPGAASGDFGVEPSRAEFSARRTSVRNEPTRPTHDNWILQATDIKPVLNQAHHPAVWQPPASSFPCKRPFDGDPREWPLFIARFKALVHDVVHNDAQRAAILSDWIGPNVHRRIDTLLTAPQGYLPALRYLQRQYGSADKVARCQIHDLLRLPACKGGDFQALQSFTDQLHAAVVILEQNGLEHDLKSSANLEQAVQKLPMAIRARWARHARDRQPVDLSDLSEFLEDAIEAERLIRPTEELIAAGKNGGREPEAKGARDRTARRAPGPGAPTVLATSATESQSQCFVCDADHAPAACVSFKRMTVDERARAVKASGLCFMCLNGKHRAASCQIKGVCGVQNCRSRHSPLLHGAARVYPERSDATSDSIRDRAHREHRDGPTQNAIAPQAARQVLLPVVPVRVSSGDRSLDTFALLDSGSEGTLIREDAAELLGLAGRRQKVRFGTFDGADPVVETRQVDFIVTARDDDRVKFPVQGAYVVPRLNVRRHCPAMPPESFPHLRDLGVALRHSQEVKLLVGMDVQDAHLCADVRRPPLGVRGPNAILTPFGWSVVGRVPARQAGASIHAVRVHHICLEQPGQLEDAVERFWKVDSFPIREAPSSFLPAEDKEALEQLRASIRHTGERYEVAVPKRADKVSRLPDNREAAKRYFLSLERRLLADAELGRAVTGAIEENLALGYAVKAEPTAEKQRMWYLTYHPVRNPNKPGKVRLVFNAAARFKGVALNDVLLKGPDLTAQLLGVFMRFRERAVGVSADISKMFYQVLVAPPDRALYRFLWRRPGSDESISEYAMTVHVFGAVSSPTACNFALQQLMVDAPDEHRSIARRIQTDFYVDNLLTSFDTFEEASATCSALIDILGWGGFPLVQFASSERRLLDGLPADIRAAPELDLDLDRLPVERTLGYLWNCQLDTMVFQFKTCDAANTKRTILAAVSSIFDPVGLLAPVVLVAKILLQDIWRLKTDWDAPLTPDILARWRRWTNELPALENLSVRRNLLTQPLSAYRALQLHAFSDASKDGYGAAVYLRSEGTQGVDVSLVLAKARVAPIHQLTIPKLELQGAVMAARLVEYCRRELTLPIAAVFYWSDATTVLRWVHASHHRFVPFVANRVSEILESSRPEQWRHVPGVLNPADDCSRGLGAEAIETDHRWLAGPEFLKAEPERWPAPFAPAAAEETPDEWIGFLTVAAEGPLDKLVAKTSDLYRLVRITAWISRFVRNVRAAVAGKRSAAVTTQTAHGPASEPTRHALTGRQQSADELKDARLVLVKVSQRACFPDDVNRLTKTKTIRRESQLLQLTPFLDGRGILRVGGRLQHAPLSEDARHPIILEPKHPLTRLLVRQAHVAVAHGPADQTLAEVRARYWVLRGREAAKAVIARCFYCARRRARPPQPLMAPLPRQRVQPHQPPFTCVGIDYFGPLTVTIGRRSEKRYGVLFTCLATRAVHLECAGSLDTDSFLLAFSRFVSRRGAPAEVFSDNGTNLRAGEKELREAVGRLNADRIRDQLARREIRWKFSPPSAPHFGGIWERLVRSCKTALRAILTTQTVKEEVLTTVLAQTEALLNNRPLTHLGADPEEMEALTPNHFLMGRPNPHLPADVVSAGESCFQKRWRQSQVLLDQIWRRWLREYLPTLTTRSKWKSEEANLQAGDLVLIVDPNSPRGHWPLARVTRVMPGEDGYVRTAEVRTRSTTYIRPVARLCRLEAENAAGSRAGCV